MKYVLLLITLFTSGKQQEEVRAMNFPKSVEVVANVPAKKNVWVFILAGQSNMAGRGFVEPQDTIPDKRILSVNSNQQIVIAKEPLHFYEPTRTGLDCGLSFGKTLLKHIPDSISILILPTAIGGSSIQQWLGDSTYRKVKLISNFREKVETGKKYGQIKAILWHQGESDANAEDIPVYKDKLSKLFNLFRTYIDNDCLPVLIGELGTYSPKNNDWQMINKAIREYSLIDNNTAIISTSDLKQKGDNEHFNSEGQRTMGQRFAEEYIKKTRITIDITK